VLDSSAERNAGDNFPFSGILILAVTLGPLFGLLWFWVYAHLIHWTGEFLKGRGTYEEIRTALAWGWLPKAVSLLPWGFIIAISGTQSFTSNEINLDDESLATLLVLLISVCGIITCNVWGIFTSSHAIAEVQGFGSAWKALGNLVIAFLVPVVILVPFVAAFIYFMRG